MTVSVSEQDVESTKLVLNTNRASALFARAVTEVEPQLPQGRAWRFSYWAQFYGQNPDAHAEDIQLVENRVINQLENKGWVARQVMEQRLDALFPRSCFSVEEALEYSEACPLWFSKPVHLSGGRGIECVAARDLAQYRLPQHSLLQQGVQNLALLEGRKFTGRIYLLVWNGQLWLFDDGFILLHGVPFDPHSTDYGVQVDHRGYDKAEGAVEMRLFSSLEDAEQRWRELETAAAALRPLLQDVLAASSEQSYLMLGIDFLLQQGEGAQFIEINAMPNFVHSTVINEQLNIPFFIQAIRVMCGLETSRLTIL